MQLTDEQEAVVRSNARVLTVQAYAGATKTTTCVEYARARPKVPMTYLAYNRSIKEEAQAKFPNNVRCVTTHGVAFAKFGKKYQHKLGNPRASNIAQALHINVVSAGKVLTVVNNYLSSSAKEIGASHVASLPAVQEDDYSSLIEYANKAWSLMHDIDSTALQMPHDGYLKLFQLSGSKINTNTILFDEAQDANPVTLDIVRRQDANQIYVGDPYQAIYGFRGAQDAFKSIKADQQLMLTKSFRFGQGIADIATAVLQSWRGATKPVQGLGELPSVFHVNQGAPHAVISRTNGQLFAEAVRLVNGRLPFGFAGGVEGYKFDQVMSAWLLYANKRDQITDHFFASFQGFAELKQYADELDDKEVKVLVRIVEEYRNDIPSLVERIKREAVRSLTGQEVTLATTHKAKGLEFPAVVMTDDFIDLNEEEQERHNADKEPPKAEEFHILYVGLTRTKSGLQLPQSTIEWLVNTGRGALIQRQEEQEIAPSLNVVSTTPVDNAVSALVDNLEILVSGIPQGDTQYAPALADMLKHYSDVMRARCDPTQAAMVSDTKISEHVTN